MRSAVGDDKPILARQNERFCGPTGDLRPDGADEIRVMQHELGDVVASGRRPPERERGFHVSQRRLHVRAVPCAGAVAFVQDA